MKLSERLRTIASLVPKGATVADIGTDHAYLPVWLCEKGICPFAVASDVMAGPLASARTHVARAGLNERIDCRRPARSWRRGNDGRVDMRYGR